MANLKKIIAAALCVIMVMALAACGPSNPGTTTAPSADSNVPAEVTGPVTIEYWHNHGGDLGVWMTEKVKEFNETNGKGITVVGEQYPWDGGA